MEVTPFDMRLSLLIEGQEGVRWDDWLRVARLTEEHGLDGLYRSDHYTAILRSRAGALDAWTTLAALAALTDRIRLGTLVSPITFRHPSVLARSAVTVDHISGGRVDVGLGLGWYEREHVENGFPFGTARERFALLTEHVEVIVRSWTEDRFDHHGDQYALRGQLALPRPRQKPHPPLILGGSVKPRFAALAAQYASEVNTLGYSRNVLRGRKESLDRACAAIGRDPGSLAFSTLITCFLGENRREADERTRAYISSGGGDRVFAKMLEATRRSWLVGSVDEVAERIRGLQALGVNRVVVRHLNHHDDDMIGLVGLGLAPRLTG